MNATTYGLDVAKRVFQMYWVDAPTGEIVNRRFGRDELIGFLAQRPAGPQGGVRSVRQRALVGAQDQSAGARGRAVACEVYSPLRADQQDRCRGRAGDLDGGAAAGNADRGLRVMADPPEPPLTSAKALVGDGRIIGTEEVVSPNLGMRYGFRDVRSYDFPLDYRLAQVFKRLGWGWNGMTFVPRKSLIPEANRETSAFLEHCAVRAVFSNLRIPEIQIGGVGWRQFAGRALTPMRYSFRRIQHREFESLARAKLGTEEEALAALFKPSSEAFLVFKRIVDTSFLP